MSTLTQPTHTRVSLSAHTIIVMTAYALIISLITGLVAGYFYAQQLTSIILITLAAVATGVLLRDGIHRSKLHQPRLAFVFAFIAATIAYSAYFGYWIYNIWQSEMDYILVENPRMSMSQQEADQAIRNLIEAETGQPLVPGLITLIIQNGVSAGAPKLGYFELDSTGTVVYWLVEYVIAVAIVIYIAVPAARRPFCVSTNKWTSMDWVGYVSSNDDLDFLDAARNHNIEQVMNLIHENPRTRDYLVVNVGHCDECSALLQVGHRNEGREVLKMEITHEQYELLMQKRTAHLENV